VQFIQARPFADRKPWCANFPAVHMGS